MKRKTACARKSASERVGQRKRERERETHT